MDDDVGAASRQRACTSPARSDIDDAERDRQVGREDVWQNAPVVLETRGVTQALRRHRRRRRPRHRSAQGHHHRPRRAERRRQDHGVQPPDRVHPARPRQSVKLNGIELVGLNPDKVARLGLVRSFQDVRLFNRISCLQNVMLAVQNQPGENLGKLLFGGRAAKRGEARDPREGDGVAELRRDEGLRRRPRRRAVATASRSSSRSRVSSPPRPTCCCSTSRRPASTPSGSTPCSTSSRRCGSKAVRSASSSTTCTSSSRLADHTYFMELGRITAEGTIDELTSSPRAGGGLLWNGLTPSATATPWSRTATAVCRFSSSSSCSTGYGTQAGRLRRRPARQRGRDRRHPRPQRQREEHDDQGDPRHRSRRMGGKVGLRGPRRHPSGLEVQRAARAWRSSRRSASSSPTSPCSTTCCSAAPTIPTASKRAERLELVYELFPILQRAVDAARRHHVRRAAAHGQPRPRAHVQARSC